MQFTATLFAAFAVLATTALAVPTARGAGQCNTGPVQCCNQITDSSDPEVVGLLNQVGLILDDVIVSVGLECSPITGIGAGGGSWQVSFVTVSILACD